jgi:hypothetical protein
MPYINEQDAAFIRRRFEQDLEANVRLLLFQAATGGIALPGQEWEIAEYTRQILVELATLSDKVRVEEYSLASNPEQAKQHGVTLTPTIVFLRDGNGTSAGNGSIDYGVRYVGLPAGYEFVTLLEIIIGVSKGRAELASEHAAMLAALNRDIHLQVFVTPT